MLILSCGDGHLTGKNPIGRIDDLTETQFNKWEEIIDFANNKDAPIITPGDIFNLSVVANSIVNRIGGILNKLHNPLYFTWGNHDLLYHSIDIWERTSLGILLQNHPMVKHISSFKEDYGISWDYINWDCSLKNSESKFLLSHKAIISNKQLKSHFWIENDKTFAEPVGKWSKQYKIIICGHWHKQYNFKSEKTLVINPGPISRTTIVENYHPSVCLINLKTGMFNKYKLESAKPFDEIMSSKHITRKENNSDNIKKLVSALTKKHSNGSLFMDNLMSVIEEHEMDKELEDLLVDVLSKTQERRNK
jgi:predicted phosphodiesterase